MATALNVSAWSTTQSSNDGADSTIGTVANTSSPTSVDDWVKGIMAAVKKYVLDTDGGLTSSGTDTITITTNRSISSGHQAAGFSLRFKAGGTNTGAATLNVDSLGAVAIKRLNGDALSAGDIVSGGIYDVAFDGTNYKLLGAGTGSGTYGTLSGSNTWSGANTFTSSVTVGNGSGDVVVIKGTTVHATMSSLLSSATITAFLDSVGSTAHRMMWRNGSAWTQTTPSDMLATIGSTAGNVLYYNGSAWVALATTDTLPSGGGGAYTHFLGLTGSTIGWVAR